jgi:hypothetical protein
MAKAPLGFDVSPMAAISSSEGLIFLPPRLGRSSSSLASDFDLFPLDLLAVVVEAPLPFFFEPPSTFSSASSASPSTALRVAAATKADARRGLARSSLSLSTTVAFFLVGDIVDASTSIAFGSSPDFLGLKNVVSKAQLLAAEVFFDLDLAKLMLGCGGNREMNKPVNLK